VPPCDLDQRVEPGDPRPIDLDRVAVPRHHSSLGHGVLSTEAGNLQGRRRWVRLHEKGGKEHDVPCHHRLDQCLHDYIEAAGITDDVDGYLFRTARRKTGQLTTNPLFQQDAHRIIRRRAKAAGIETRIGNHTFRATGITAYLKNSETAILPLSA
jgi:integrase